MRLERWFYTVPLRLRSLFRSRQAEQELDEELRYHLERKIEEGIGNGLSPAEARYAALRAMDGLEQRKEECRDARHTRVFADLLQDLHYGLRQLRRSPAFALMATVTLALGIGTTAAVFSLADATLLAHPPYAGADRLVEISIASARSVGSVAVAEFQYAAWRQSGRSCDRVAGFAESDSTLAGGAGAEFPARVHLAYVSEDFFPLLGVTAAVGRTFQPADFPSHVVPVPGTRGYFRQFEFAPGEVPPIVISNRLFRARFAGSRALLGQTLEIEGRPYAVIGVMPGEFQFPPGADVWVPHRASGGLLIARLAPGMSKDQVKAELDSVINSASPLPGRPVGYPPGYEYLRSLLPLYQSKVVSLREYLVGNVRTSVLVLLGAVSLALLIACINVTNLLLLRNQKRRHEMGVRAALGASSSRLARQTLTESALLALIGGAAGVLLARWMIGALPALAPQGLLPKSGVALDTRLLLFAVLVTALTSVVVGILPALRQPWSALSEAIKQAGGHETTPGRGVLHAALVSAQIALTLVLLCGAGLMIRSFILLHTVIPDFRGANMATFDVALRAGGAGWDLEQMASSLSYKRQSWQRLIEQLERLPGVKRAASAPCCRARGREPAGP
jgi:predicted permease